MKSKNKNLSINIIFTLLFLIMSALFLIYIFRDILLIDTSFINSPFKVKENFLGSPYSWKYGDGNNICRGSLYTNTELQNPNSLFRTGKYNRFENAAVYNKTNLQNPSHQYSQYCDVMSYSDLLAYRCLNKSPYSLAGVLNAADIKYTGGAVFLYNDTSLFSYVLSKIQNEKNKLSEGKIIGPVYVCISQAPYLKYKNDHRSGGLENTLDARIDILNNRNPYYYEQIDSAGVQSFVTNTSGYDDSTRTQTGIADSKIIPSSLYCQILIIFPLYKQGEGMILKDNNTDKQNTLIETFLNTTMTPHYSDNELCNIKCNKSLTLNCGCLTYNSSTVLKANSNTYFDNTKDKIPIQKFDLPDYTAKCIDHTTTPNNMNAAFSMMYYVNPFSDKYGGDDDGDKNLLQEPY